MTAKIIIFIALASSAAANCAYADEAANTHSGASPLGLSGKTYDNPENWPMAHKSANSKTSDTASGDDEMKASISDVLLRAEEVNVAESSGPIKEEVPADMEAADAPTAQPAAKTPTDTKKHDAAPAITRPVKTVTAKPAPAKNAKQAEELPGYMDSRPDGVIFSDEMPQDSLSGIPATCIPVPKSWQPDGWILSADIGNQQALLAERGDIVEIYAKPSSAIAPGDFIGVYERANSVKIKGRKNLLIQRVALLQAVTIKGRHVTAQVIEAQTAIDKGGMIKRLEGK